MNAAKAIALSALLVLTGLLAGCPAPGDAGTDESVTLDPERLQCLRWQSQCGDECVDRQTDIDNCGTCGNACDSGELCSQGQCVSECSEGLERCGDACVNLDDSEEHCGECGNRCVADGAEGYCSPEGCSSWVCRPNRLDDDGDRSDGCERSCEGARLEGGQRDIDIDVFDVRGTLTIAGEPPEGREVGAVVFESLDIDRGVFAPVFPVDDYNYRIDVFPGLYTVRLVDDNACNPRYTTCPGPVLRDVVEITGDTELDMNLGADEPFPGGEVLVSGEIRLDGEQVADAGTNQGYRARVTFAGPYEHHQLYVSNNGPAIFEGSIPSGTYRVTARSLNCDVMPCQEKVVDESMTISETTNFNWDFETIEVTGEVTVGGDALSDSGTGNARGEVQLRSADRTSTGSVSARLSSTGPGTYSIWAYPGTYDIALNNQTDCPGDGSGAIPCTGRTVAHGVEARSDTERDIDIEVVTLDGEVMLNGREMIDSPATRNRGQLHIDGQAGAYQVNFGAAGAVEYGVKVYPGAYRVTVSNNGGCNLSRPVIPCQSKDMGIIDLDESTTRDFDLQVATVVGELTVDGQPLADTEDASRGSVILLPPDENSGPAGDLGRTGPAEFSLRAFAGEGYRLVFDRRCYGDGEQSVPCGQSTIAEDLDISNGRRVDLDLKPIQLSGVLSANGRELEELNSNAVLLLENGATSVVIPLENEAGGRFVASVFPGVYRVLYRHQTYDCVGEMPCGEKVIRERVTVRAGVELDIDLDVVELEGTVTYQGRDLEQRAQGRLLFRHDGEQVRVPTDNGNYGPVELLDSPYVVQMDSYTCRQSSPVPCMPYLVDGCER